MLRGDCRDILAEHMGEPAAGEESMRETAGILGVAERAEGAGDTGQDSVESFLCGQDIVNFG